jgi:serine/threonine-protein phosphatase 2A regulatory subunit A
LFFINKLAGEVTKEVLNKNFADTLITLAEDPVPNIRFNVSKTIDQVYSRLTPGNKIKCEGALEKMCKDTDFDVHFYANLAMQKISKL